MVTDFSFLRNKKLLVMGENDNLNVLASLSVVKLAFENEGKCNNVIFL
jgi:hypothetical protein